LRPADPVAVDGVPDTQRPGPGRVGPVEVNESASDDGTFLTAGEEKRAFLAALQPLILAENERLRESRERVLALGRHLGSGVSLEAEDKEMLRRLAGRYGVDGDPVSEPEAFESLASRVDVVPVSLALAQAANESAWGRSRFAREGRNLFGIWTYDPDKGMVPRDRETGKKHLVRKFDSLGESVSYYMHTLNSHAAYDAFRVLRAAQRRDGEPLDSLVLATGLERYSAKGGEYVRLIQDIIERNDLLAFDSDPASSRG